MTAYTYTDLSIYVFSYAVSRWWVAVIQCCWLALIRRQQGCDHRGPSVASVAVVC